MRCCYSNDPELEARIRAIIATVAARLDESVAAHAVLEAVVLGGGYGRGEGGVFTAPDGTRRLYNDLDLFVFGSGNGSAEAAGKLREELLALETELSTPGEFEVEFGPAVLPDELAGVSDTLMYQELRRGFVPVWGDARGVMNRIVPREFSALPLSEGWRLLLNRGTGLLLAAEHLAKSHAEQRVLTAHEADFVQRNIGKAFLAVGDAWLLARGRYEFGIVSRHALLRSGGAAGTPGFSALLAADYEQAMQFKLTPRPPDGTENWDELWYRAVAAWQLAVADFQMFYTPTGPKNLKRRLKNLLLNLRYCPAVGPGRWCCHPREHLVAVLSAILFDKMRNDRYINQVDHKSALRPAAGKWVEKLRPDYLALWRRFN